VQRAFEYREPVAVSTHLRARRQQHGGKTRFHALCGSIAFLLAAAARGHVLGIVYFLVAIAALATFVFDFPISTIFATSSIVAVILGFALQNTLADLFIGLAMSIEQPFRVGDRIELGDRGGGRVNGMNWRATHILAINGDLVVVPNSMLSCGRIVNHDSPLASTHRSAVSIKLGNTIAPARATEVLKAAALSATGVLASPAPRVDIASYGDWAIEYKVLFHFADWGDESEIASHVFGTVWSHLSWAGISQPASGRLFRGSVALDRRCAQRRRRSGDGRDGL